MWAEGEHNLGPRKFGDQAEPEGLFARPERTEKEQHHADLHLAGG